MKSSIRSLSTAMMSLVAICLMATPGFAKSSLDGEITVANSRHSAISVRVDGRAMGRVPPGKRRVLRGIPNGVRLVVISGKHGPPTTRRVSVPIQGRAKIRLAPRVGSTRIENNSSISMKISIGDRFIGTVGPGRTITKSRLRAGDHVVTATPSNYRFAKSGSMSQVLTVRAGARTQLELGKFLGQLKVTNSNQRRVRLYIDGVYARHLGAGQSTVLRALTPGAHSLSMKRRGRTISTTSVRIDFGQTAYWKPQAHHRGKIRIANRSGRQISVSIDGRRQVRLSAGEATTVRNLRAGVHSVTITRPRGRVEHRRVRVPRADEAVVTVFSPRRRHAHRSAGSVYVAQR